MKKAKIWGYIIGAAVVALFIVFALVFDFAEIWGSWGLKIDQDGHSYWVYPDWWYFSLFGFRLVLYFAIPLSVAISCLNVPSPEDSLPKRKRFFALFLSHLSFCLLFLTLAKATYVALLAGDRVFGVEIFESINEIETLAGSVATLILKKNIKVEGKLTKPSDFVSVLEENGETD